MSTSTVFIIDDDPSARRGLTRLVSAAGLNVESFPSAHDFLASGRQSNPGCIVLDVKMPEMTGPELQEELGKADYCPPLIFISAYGDVPTTARAMKKGAVDVLTKPIDCESLLAAITEALAKDAENRAMHAAQESFFAGLATLTRREHEVLTYVISGMLNKQIALVLNISETTVKIHRGRVMRKLRSDSLPELARMCDRAGITPATPIRERQPIL